MSAPSTGPLSGPDRGAARGSAPLSCGRLAPFAIIALLGGCTFFETTPSESVASRPATQRFLTYNEREGTEAEAEAYVIATGQEPTLEEFQKVRCLVDGATIDYFNFADLALGRRLSFARCQGRISACVENGGMPGQNASHGLSALGSGAKVAVCMDYLASRPRGYKTQFYVYVDDKPATGLEFDSQGKKLSPFACTACHGGRYRDDGSPARHVEHGFFLPLLKESLVFSETPDEELFRKMNALVYETHDAEDRAPGVLQLLDAAYPSSAPGQGVHQLGAEYMTNALPAVWVSDEALYRGLIRPHCLTCHAAQIDGATAFETPEQVASRRALITLVACDQGLMPNSLEGDIQFAWDPIARPLAGCH